MGSFCWGGFCSIPQNARPSGSLCAFDARESADIVDADDIGHAFCTDEAFCLKTAEFIGGTEKLALRAGSGSIDRSLDVGEDWVFGSTLHFRLGDGAAAKTPGGVDDFGGQGLLERAVGAEILLKAMAEEFIGVDFVRTDEVGSRIDAEGDGITR